MTVNEALVWVALPYVATVIFIGGHIWRYRQDQFGWTCRSTQILENRLLAPGSILFHYGTLAAIGGHALGILVPASLTGALGITESYYHIISAGAGTVASIAVVAGLVILIYRRRHERRSEGSRHVKANIVFRRNHHTAIAAHRRFSGLRRRGIRCATCLANCNIGNFYPPRPTALGRNKCPILRV